MDGGVGRLLSIRVIVKETGLSRNTVRKYLRLDVKQIGHYFDDTDRISPLDNYLIYIKHLLETFPELSAVKIMRKLNVKGSYPI